MLPILLRNGSRRRELPSIIARGTIENRHFANDQVMDECAVHHSSLCSHVIIQGMDKNARNQSSQSIGTAVLCCLLLAGLSIHVPGAGTERASDAMPWRADHHMHVASADLCSLVGECLSSNHPPAVFASDAIAALDAANVSKGVILSCAYLYGMPSLHLTPHDIATRTRRENEFTAAEVAKYPTRLVGFLSVNPLQSSAIDEIRHWKGSNYLVGLKLHFTASAVR